MAFKSLDVLLSIFIVLAIVLTVVNISMITSISQKAKEATLLAEKENQPAKLELVRIIDSSCKDCFNIDAVVEGLKKANLNIISERTLEFSSAEAKQLVEQYNIEKLPTVIVLGEVNKSAVVNLWNQNWQVEMKDGTQVSAVYAGLSPPYLDLANNRITGRVSLTHIKDASCSECSDLTPVILFFKQNGVIFFSEKEIDYSSPEAQELINKFSVQRIPAIVVSKDILDYDSIKQIWDQVNATEKEGFYALHTTAPPYRDLAKNKVEGLVTVIYLKDQSCAQCYNVSINKIILERNFGLVIVNETTVDISSDFGKSLIKQYSITKVPIIIVSSDASIYDRFVLTWLQVGDTASDGWFIMREPAVLGAYKDLSTGQVII